MKVFFHFIFLCILTSNISAQIDEQIDKQLYDKAVKLAHEFILIDTHVDAPLHQFRKWRDLTKVNDNLEFDFVRAQKGGLDVPFMSVYTSPSLEFNGAFGRADSLIDLVKRMTDEWPDNFVLAVSTNDVLKNAGSGKILLAMGMENGSPIEGKIENVKYFYDKGIRYITPAHGKWNHISDSSYDEDKHWNGLSPFGEEVIKEMNRLGIMVDVSHISDSAFYDIMRISKAPVIASHSSCRHFVPGFERNMSDEMIKLLAEKGGVMMINFGSSFIDSLFDKQEEKRYELLKKLKKENGIKEHSEEENKFESEFNKEHPKKYATVVDVANHIDHVVKLVGVDYVGIGSDFDGVGDSLPEGLKNVSDYPNLIYELLKRGYSDDDIKKICGGNLLRVWKQVEDYAANQK